MKRLPVMVLIVVMSSARSPSSMVKSTRPRGGLVSSGCCCTSPSDMAPGGTGVGAPPGGDGAAGGGAAGAGGAAAVVGTTAGLGICRRGACVQAVGVASANAAKINHEARVEVLIDSGEWIVRWGAGCRRVPPALRLRRPPLARARRHARLQHQAR